MIVAFPLFALLLVAYNALMFTGDVQATLAGNVFEAGLISGANWQLTGQDLFVIVGVLALYFEIFKSTRTGVASVIDHVLSTAVFVIFLVEFLTVAGCGTSTFFILGLMALLDVVAGFTVSIVAARRDIGFNNPG